MKVKKETAFTKTLRNNCEGGEKTYLSQGDVSTRTNEYNLPMNTHVMKMSRQILTRRKMRLSDSHTTRAGRTKSLYKFWMVLD